MKFSQFKLPRLVFGDGFEKSVRMSPRSCAEFSDSSLERFQISYTLTSKSYFERSNVCEFGGVKLATKSYSPIIVELPEANLFSMAISAYGSATDISPRSIGQWSSLKSIFFGAYERPITWKTDTQSFAMIIFEKEKIMEVSSTMQNTIEPDNIHNYIHQSRILPALCGKTNFYTIFYNLFNLIDALYPDTHHMENIGLGEIFYRTAIRFMMSELDQKIISKDDFSDTKSSAAIDVICSAIRANTSKPLNSTEMEKLAGLSARAIQLAFNNKFGCSPQEWQRNHRLDRARHILASVDYHLSIKNLSYELGFFSPQSFSSYYKKRFGELPTETLKKKS